VIELAELCSRFRVLTVPEVCDALYELQLPEQVLSSRLRPLLPEKSMVGEAFTVLGTDTIPPVGWDEGVIRVQSYLQMLEHVTPDSVMIHTNQGPSRMGNYGELTANAVQQRGCQGVILDGNLRDSAGMRSIDFQIFYKDLSPLNGIGRWHLVSFQERVTVDGIEISPGDIIFADFDGVLVIPRADAEQVLLKAEDVSAAEVHVRHEMQNGMAPLASFQAHGHF
jgi:4-hydroxy-4-methyl-2-oxoglutarate aldolase